MAVEDDRDQLKIMRHLDDVGIGNSGIIDRFWFHSLYFRDPDGNLLEVATEGPGYSADESPETLGSSLVLPKWVEPRRSESRRSSARLTRGTRFHGLRAILSPDMPEALTETGRAGKASCLPQSQARSVSYIGSCPRRTRTRSRFCSSMARAGTKRPPKSREPAPSGAALLSPRKVLENGMPRSFRRLAEGVFDVNDLVNRTEGTRQVRREGLGQARLWQEGDRGGLLEPR